MMSTVVEAMVAGAHVSVALHLHLHSDDAWPGSPLDLWCKDDGDQGGEWPPPDLARRSPESVEEERLNLVVLCGSGAPSVATARRCSGGGGV